MTPTLLAETEEDIALSHLQIKLCRLSFVINEALI